MDCDCKSVFNRLSKGDRLKLRGAALTKAITGYVRDDTEKKPWLYPFYVVYIATIATPLPFFGAGALTIAATAAWAKWGTTKGAKELNKRMTAAFNEAALVCEHKDVIEHDSDKAPANDNGEKKPRVNNLKLAWGTTKAAANDSWQATKHAWNALKKLTM